MTLAVDIIKKDGKRQTEQFMRSKLHASILAACLSAKSPEGQAETIAIAVCDAVDRWLESRLEVTSRDLRVVASRHLDTYHPQAAYLYEQHRITI